MSVGHCCETIQNENMESSKPNFRLKSATTLFNIFIQICTLCPFFVEGIDLLEECKRTDDSHVTRGNFTCCASSPRSLPLQSSLDFQTGWKKCAVEPEVLNEDPVISAWRVYRCIIFDGIHGKPLLPTTYTGLLTQNYPALIKSQIYGQMSELEDGTMKFEVDVECLKRTPYPKVHLLRNLFYEAEQEICEAGNNLTNYNGNEEDIANSARNRPTIRKFNNMRRSHTWTQSDLEEILCETCDRTKEMYHRNGDCCSHVSVPFPFIHLPYRYGNNDRVSQCAEELADDVGLPADTEFSTHLQYLCYASCEHYLSGNLEESDLWTGAQMLQSQSEIKSLIMKIMPKYFSSKYKQEIMQYALVNFRLAWIETKTFESKIQIGQLDSRNLDKEKLKNLLASCKTHKLIETIINLYLNNLCLEQYPLHEPNATTPKSLIHAFMNNTTPASTASSNDEVILNFQWGTPNRRDQNRHHKHDYDEDENSDRYGGGGTGDGGSFLDFGNLTSSRTNNKWKWPLTTMPPMKGQFIKVY